MAKMINCAVDWTYDKYFEDVSFFDIDNSMEDEYYPAYFVSFMKKAVEKFRSEWVEEHTYLYARGYGYVGDAFAETLQDGWFSDFYKDAYGQRPHLPIWFYIHPLGLPMQEDTARMFCADPIREARINAFEERYGIAWNEAVPEDDETDDACGSYDDDPICGSYDDDPVSDYGWYQQDIIDSYRRER